MGLAIVAMFMASTFGVLGQTQTDTQKIRQRLATTPPQDKNKKDNQKPAPAPKTGERLEPDDTSRTPVDVPQDTVANRQEQISEEAAVVPYYNNFFNTYRLGPEDVISVQIRHSLIATA